MTGDRGRESGGDLVVGLLLAALSLYVVVQAVAMPRPKGWHSAPGLLPLIVGATLLLLSAVLTVGALRAGGWWRLVAGARGLRRAWRSPTTAWRTLLMVGAVWAYVYILLPRLPFEVATFLFLALTLVALWRRSPLRLVLVSAAVGVALSLLFGKFLRTLLPGAGSML